MAGETFNLPIIEKIKSRFHRRLAFGLRRGRRKTIFVHVIALNRGGSRGSRSRHFRLPFLFLPILIPTYNSRFRFTLFLHHRPTGLVQRSGAYFSHRVFMMESGGVQIINGMGSDWH